MNGWSDRAEAQYGVVTRAQLREFGQADRQIHALGASGQLEREHAGVFRVSGSYRSARPRAIAACLWCGDYALLSRGAAASLLRLPAVTSDIHVTVPRRVKRSSDAIAIHRTLDLERRDRFVVDGLPCTSPTRTIIDLAASLEGEALEHTFDSARRLGLTTKVVLERRAVELCQHGRPGSTAVRELLRLVDCRPKGSRLEVRTARLLRAHGLQPEATQHRVERYRLDFAWPSTSLAVECDGFEWHGNRLA